MIEAARKPRPRRTPRYCHHKASGLGRCTIDGRDFYFGPWEPQPIDGNPLSSGRAAYQRLIEAWQANDHELPDEAAMAEPLTIDQLLYEYMLYAFGDPGAAAPQGRYRDDAGQLTSHGAKIKRVMSAIRSEFGHRHAANFGPAALTSIYEGFVERGTCRKTANEYLHIIKTIFSWLVSRELIPVERLIALQTVKGRRSGEAGMKDHPPRMPVSREAMDAVEPFVSRQVWAIINLQDCCGARPTEILQMRPCDLQVGIMVGVKRDDGQVEQIEVWRYTPVHHKTKARGKIRCIELGPRAQEIIQPFLAMRPLAAYIFSPVEAENERRAKMAAARKSRETPSQQRRRAERANRPPRAGARYSRDSYRRSIRRACAAAGIDSWCPYQIRHSVATRLDEAENIEVVMAVLGNATESAQIYVHRSRQRAMRAMAIHG